MSSKWLDALKEEESKHNTVVVLREGVTRRALRPARKSETPTNRTDKTDKIASGYKAGGEKPEASANRTDKNDKILSDADRLGLVATWSGVFGYVSIHDPTAGEWHDLPVKDAPDWAVREARKRKELYRDGNRKAYRLTARELEEIWEAERAPKPEGIVEEHPIEEEED